MAQTSAKYAGTVANDASAGTAAWTNATNAQGSNDATVASVASGTTTTQRLKATNFGFTSSDIPSGSTINGFLIRLRLRGGTTNRANLNELYAVQGGTIQTGGSNLGTATKFTATLANISFGSTTELFGLSWVDTDVTASDFGLSINVARSNTTTVECAWFEVIVDYTAPSATSGTINATESTDTAVIGSGVTYDTLGNYYQTYDNLPTQISYDDNWWFIASILNTSIAATDSSDTTAVVGTIATAATIAAVESSDTTSLSATVSLGSLSATDNSDTVSVTAVSCCASISATDNSDTVSVSAISTNGIISAVESTDVTSVTAISTFARLSATESTDTTSVTAVSTLGSISATDNTDTTSLTAITCLTSISATDNSDTTAATGISAFASFVATDSSDTTAITGSVTSTTDASIAAIDSSDTTTLTGISTLASVGAVESSDTTVISVTSAMGSLTLVDLSDTTSVFASASSTAYGSIDTVETADTTDLQASVETLGAPGYDFKRKKYVVKVGDRLMVFNREIDALNALPKDEPVKQYPAKKGQKPKFEPIWETRTPEVTLDLAAIQASAALFNEQAKYQDLLRQRHYDALIALYEEMREREEEDDLLLLLAA